MRHFYILEAIDGRFLKALKQSTKFSLVSSISEATKFSEVEVEVIRETLKKKKRNPFYKLIEVL